MPVRTNYSWWDDRLKQEAPIRRDEDKEREKAHIFDTPKNIYNYFDSEVYGCHEYKKALATAVWSSLRLHTKTNFLVIGPSGCGTRESAQEDLLQHSHLRCDIRLPRNLQRNCHHIPVSPRSRYRRLRCPAVDLHR